MGTRGVVGFRVDKVDKITYNHFDSYPEELGRKVIQFLDSHGRSIRKLKKLARNIKMVNEQDKPTFEQEVFCGKYLDYSVSEQSDDDWYCLLRGAQGSLQAYCDVGYMVDSVYFIKDSLFCEYGYVINLDEKTLEFYVGFQTEPDRSRKNRYKTREPQDNSGKYWHCKLLARFPLESVTYKELKTVNNKHDKERERETL